VVVKQAKKLVESHVNAGWLNHPHVERVELDTSGFNLGADIAIAKKHALSLSLGPSVSGFMSVVICILSDLPPTTGGTGK
jgi:hypothetical protein